MITPPPPAVRRCYIESLTLVYAVCFCGYGRCLHCVINYSVFYVAHLQWERPKCQITWRCTVMSPESYHSSNQFFISTMLHCTRYKVFLLLCAVLWIWWPAHWVASCQIALWHKLRKGQRLDRPLFCLFFSRSCLSAATAQWSHSNDCGDCVFLNTMLLSVQMQQ